MSLDLKRGLRKKSAPSFPPEETSLGLRVLSAGTRVGLIVSGRSGSGDKVSVRKVVLKVGAEHISRALSEEFQNSKKQVKLQKKVLI